jgi:hypothetical protein
MFHVKRQHETMCIQMTNENTNNDATTTNDVVTNANNDDATTLTLTKNDDDTTTQTTLNAIKTRATTRAIANVKIAKNAKSKTIRDDANNEILIVRTSTNALRIDHTMCYENNVHANDKNARSQCRARIARANAKK